MRASTRSIFSSDIDDTASWSPDSEEWALRVHVVAGPADGPGEESFDLAICSGEWLAEQARRDGIFDPRHHLVVDGFKWPELYAYLQRRVEQCHGDKWEDVAQQLSRLGRWEFEDYAP